MKLETYAIYDAKAESYGQPFFLQNDGVAIRLFAGYANDKKTMIGQHPEDFSIFWIGTYDDSNGEIKQKKFRSLASAPALVKEMPTFVPEIANGKENVQKV